MRFNLPNVRRSTRKHYSFVRIPIYIFYLFRICTHTGIQSRVDIGHQNLPLYDALKFKSHSAPIFASQLGDLGSWYIVPPRFVPVRMSGEEVLVRDVAVAVDVVVDVAQLLPGGHLVKLPADVARHSI